MLLTNVANIERAPFVWEIAGLHRHDLRVATASGGRPAGYAARSGFASSSGGETVTPEVAHHRHDSAVALLVVGGRSSFKKMLATCFSTAPIDDDEALRDSGVGLSFGHQAEHLALFGGEPGERVGLRLRARSCRTTSGSRAVPPAATRWRASMNSSTSLSGL